MNNCKSKCQCMDCVLLPELQLEEVEPEISNNDKLMKLLENMERLLDKIRERKAKR